MSEYTIIFTRDGERNVALEAAIEPHGGYPRITLRASLDGKTLKGNGTDSLTRLPSPAKHPSGKVIVAAIGEKTSKGFKAGAPVIGFDQAEYDTITAACDTLRAADPGYIARKEREAAAEAARVATRDRLLAEMAAKVAGMVRQIPLNARRVEVQSRPSDSVYMYYDSYYLDGVKLPESEVIVIGDARATMPSVAGAFAREVVAYVLRSDAEIAVEQEEARVAKATAEREARKAAAATERAAKFAEAKATGQPVLLDDRTELVNGDEEFESVGERDYALPDGSVKTEFVREVVG